MQNLVPQSRASVLGRCRSWLALAPLLCWLALPLGAATVTLDGSQTFQTIDGFGANLFHWNTNELAPVVDALIDQGGMTLFRLVHDHQDWHPPDTNANVLNWKMDWDYYNRLFTTPDFQNQWDLMAYLNHKGITNNLLFCFMTAPTSSPVGQEAYWAEVLTATLLYARNACHLQFTLVEPANEPDRFWLSMSQEMTGLHYLAQCLDANGLSELRFVGPALAGTSLPWIGSWLDDSVVRAKLAHVAVHCYNDNYGGPSSGVYDYLQQSSYPSMNFWMTEYNQWCSSCEGGGSGDNSWSFARGSVHYLLNHLRNGAAGAMIFTGCDTWATYLHYPTGDWSYWGLFAVDNINVTPKTFSPRKGFYGLTQVSRYVRPGARRIALGGTTTPFNLLAFYHPDSGQVVIVGVNPNPATALTATLASLPPVAGFDLYYTSSSVNTNLAGTVPVTNSTFSTTIPADCVFTLVARPSVSVLLTNPPEGTTYAAPATLPLGATASSSLGVITGVAFYAGTTKLGEALVPPYALTWNDVPPGTYALTAWATNSLGHTGASPAVHVTVVGPPTQVLVSPASVLVPPYGTQQFTATVTDVAGTPVSPQPLVNWSVETGGSIDSNGLFTAGGIPGGPFTVTAASGALSGAALVSIATNGTPFLPLQPTRFVRAGTLLVVTNAAIADSLVNRLVTNLFAFAYANRASLLADGWNFLAAINGASRNTEITNPATGPAVVYNAAGPLTIPCDQGDLWGSLNNSRNSLFRSLPADWLSIQLSCAFAPTANYQQAHLTLYQDDDNYLELGLGYNSNTGGKTFSFTRESAGAPTTLLNLPTSATDAWFRLDRSPGNGALSGFYSLDGLNWTPMVNTTSSLLNPRLAIWTGSAYAAYASGMPSLVVRRASIVASNAVPRTLTYSLLNPPSGATIDTNGIISWLPTLAQVGTNILTTRVVDNGSPPLVLTNSFTVVVTPPPPFHILSVAVSNDVVRLTWESESGQAYRLQYKHALEETSWQELQPDIVAAGPRTIASNHIGTATSGYYRIRLLP
jgi:O-glycosyl hydrolase